MEAVVWIPEHRTPVHCVQFEPELDWLLDIYRALNPRRVLEIGSHVGGTLWHWMEHAAPGAAFTVVSLAATAHVATWQRWADAKEHTLHVLDADSTAPLTIDWMRARAPYDFAFIDGSHWYEYVSKDYAHAREMVKPGGIVALHDITEHTYYPAERVDVPRVWREIKASGARTDELIVSPDVCCGIGVVYISL